MASESSGALGTWYRDRIGTPTTDDEVFGYWLFVVGAVLAVVGFLLFFATSPGTTARAIAFALPAAGLVLLLVGPTIRLPLASAATWLAYVGAAVGAVAILWFLTVYPGSWSRPNGHAGVVLTYLVGLGLIVVGGVFVPLLMGRTDTEESPVADTDSEAATADELAESERAREELQADLDAAEAALAATKESKAQFELYEDSAGKWRWRLRHRNGNIIADSSQGYSSRQKAEQGMRSVQHNAVGAAVTVQRDEEEDETEAAAEQVPAEESQSDFEIYEDSAGEWRWRLRHRNGNIIADSSQGYASRSNVERALESVRELVPGAAYLDIDPVAFEVYEDEAGEWRWRLRHQNGNILADGGQGYSSRTAARESIESVVGNAPDADIEELD